MKAALLIFMAGLYVADILSLTGFLLAAFFLFLPDVLNLRR